jgi:hypothetical protein
MKHRGFFLDRGIQVIAPHRRDRAKEPAMVSVRINRLERNSEAETIG